MTPSPLAAKRRVLAQTQTQPTTVGTDLDNSVTSSSPADRTVVLSAQHQEHHELAASATARVLSRGAEVVLPAGSNAVDIDANPGSTAVAEAYSHRGLRPLPMSKMAMMPRPAHERAVRVLVRTFQTQLARQGTAYTRQSERAQRRHEFDLANVVLAYDARIETLEQRCRTRDTEVGRLRQLLERLRLAARVQREQLTRTRRLARERRNGDEYSPRGQRQKRLEDKEQLKRRVTVPAAPGDNNDASCGDAGDDQQPWLSQRDTLGMEGSPDNSNNICIDGHEDGVSWDGSELSSEGEETYDTSKRHSGSINPLGEADDADSAARRSSGLASFSLPRSRRSPGSFDQATTDEVARLQEELAQYQEALAESARALEHARSEQEAMTGQTVGTERKAKWCKICWTGSATWSGRTKKPKRRYRLRRGSGPVWSCAWRRLRSSLRLSVTRTPA